MLGKKISFFLFRVFIALFKIIPFWLLYRLSDFVYFIFFYILSYRKNVVIKNLKKCFPEKSEQELKRLRKNFYKILSDIILETFKGFTMSKDELLKRFKVKENNVAEKYFQQGKDVIVLLGHFANWEWAIASVVEKFNHHPAVLYKPISNQLFDKYFRDKRGRYGAGLVSIYETRQYFMKEKPKPVMYYMGADQYPPNKEKQKNATFFGTNTAFLNGPEKYATQLNIPVIYLEIQRVKRGFYTMELMDVCEQPKDLTENELTQMYASLLEKSIKKQPENWMWSHKRWKRELYSFD